MGYDLLYSVILCYRHIIYCMSLNWDDVCIVSFLLPHYVRREQPDY